jgi:Tfp pilus assembly protein FimT
VESQRLIHNGYESFVFGFTLIEILVVVVIIMIAAMTVIPMMGSAASVQLRSASNLIAADLEYTKSLAITRQEDYTVVFYEDTESYEVQKNGTVIQHPVNKGFDYRVNFTTDSRLNGVDIYSVDFNSGDSVKFDCLGSPLNGGVITLKAGNATTTINVSAVTGFVSIN